MRVLNHDRDRARQTAGKSTSRSPTSRGTTPRFLPQDTQGSTRQLLEAWLARQAALMNGLADLHRTAVASFSMAEAEFQVGSPASDTASGVFDTAGFLQKIPMAGDLGQVRQERAPESRDSSVSAVPRLPLSARSSPTTLLRERTADSDGNGLPYYCEVQHLCESFPCKSSAPFAEAPRPPDSLAASHFPGPVHQTLSGVSSLALALVPLEASIGRIERNMTAMLSSGTLSRRMSGSSCNDMCEGNSETLHPDAGGDVDDASPISGSPELVEMKKIELFSCQERRLSRGDTTLSQEETVLDDEEGTVCFEFCSGMVKEGHHTGFRGKVAEHFDGERARYVVGSVILANSLFIGYTTQYAIDNLRAQTNSTIILVETFFLVAYLLEFFVKVYVHRQYYWCGAEWNWNNFDFFLILTALYDSAMTFSDTQGGHLAFLRLPRLVKMMKILRLVRVLKFFRELRLMLAAIIGSVSLLFWCFILLAAVLYLNGLVFVQAVTGYLSELTDDEIGTDSVAQDAIECWGSVFAAQLSIFQSITGGRDWKEVADPLRTVGEIYYFMFVLCIGFLTFAVLNILTGIFVENAMVQSDCDRDNIAHQDNQQLISFKEDVARLFIELDNDKSGTVSWSEFRSNIVRPEFKAFFRALEIDVRDAEFFFRLVTQNSPTGEVGYDMFLESCSRLKGNAKMLDVQALACQAKILFKGQERLGHFCEDMFRRILKDKKIALPRFSV